MLFWKTFAKVLLLNGVPLLIFWILCKFIFASPTSSEALGSLGVIIFLFLWLVLVATSWMSAGQNLKYVKEKPSFQRFFLSLIILAISPTLILITSSVFFQGRWDETAGLAFGMTLMPPFLFSLLVFVLGFFRNLFSVIKVVK